MPSKLKVYRTPIGFHDAYVAAPSQKAALEAWGADANLFARGVAEKITDDALTKEALTRPGEVIRKVRGTLAEHMAALPKTPIPARRDTQEKGSMRTPVPKASPKPRPKRNELDAAETALSDAEEERSAILQDFAEREAALARERRQAERDRNRSIERLQKARDEAESRYKAAVADWRAE